MHTRMLPNVERVKMESELPDSSEERRNVDMGETLSVIRLQARLDQHQILLELLGAAIALRSIDGLASALQLVKNIREESPIAFSFVLWPPCEVHAENGALVMA